MALWLYGSMAIIIAVINQQTFLMHKSLLLTLQFPPDKGGVENYLASICNYLDRKKIQVLAPKEKETGNFDSQQTYKIHRRKFFYNFFWPRWFLLLKNTWKLVNQEKIELLQCGQVLPCGTVALILKILKGVPYIIYTYALDITQPKNSWHKKIILKKVLQNSEKIVTISNFTKKEITSLGIPDYKIIKISPGINTTDLNIPTDTEKIKSQFFLQKKKIILTVGRLVERKGQDMVIKSLPEVLKRVPETAYVIVGYGPYLDQLKELTKKLKLQDKVIFTGALDNKTLLSFYKLCDVFIMPSRPVKNDFEGFGIVFLEASFFAKPVIGGKSGGVEDAIIDNQTGLLVNPSDKNKISQSIIKLLTNENLAKKMGEEGKKRVEKEFNWQILIKKLEKIL